MGQCLILLAAMLISTAAFLFGLIGGGALAFAWALSLAGFVGLLLIRDGHCTLRRAGIGLGLAAALGLGLALTIHPAHAADGIVAPPGDTVFWGTVNGWIADGLGSIAVAVVSALCLVLRTRAKINIRTDQEQRLVEVLKTGLYQGMHEMELTIDDHWTPEQRAKLVERMLGWAETRAATELKKLGLPSFVVTALARKVIGIVQGSLGLDAADAAISASAFPGNPGETPALDRAAGGTGGA